MNPKPYVFAFVLCCVLPEMDYIYTKKSSIKKLGKINYNRVACMIF